MPFQQIYSLLTINQLRESITFAQAKFQGIDTKVWLLHECRFLLVDQKLLLSRNLQVLQSYLLNLSVDSKALNHDGKFYANANKLKLAIFSIINSELAKVAMHYL